METGKNCEEQHTLKKGRGRKKAEKRNKETTTCPAPKEKSSIKQEKIHSRESSKKFELVYFLPQITIINLDQ